MFKREVGDWRVAFCDDTGVRYGSTQRTDLSLESKLFDEGVVEAVAFFDVCFQLVVGGEELFV